jgi:hypothetical protein
MIIKARHRELDSKVLHIISQFLKKVLDVWIRA